MTTLLFSVVGFLGLVAIDIIVRNQTREWTARRKSLTMWGVVALAGLVIWTLGGVRISA